MARHAYLDGKDLNTEQFLSLAVEQAVKAFQKERQITEDGIVGPIVVIYLTRINEGN